MYYGEIREKENNLIGIIIRRREYEWEVKGERVEYKGEKVLLVRSFPYCLDCWEAHIRYARLRHNELIHHKHRDGDYGEPWKKCCNCGEDLKKSTSKHLELKKLRDAYRDKA